jgi:hypothetical protein
MKDFEVRLLDKMLEEIFPEPLCNILLYAATYLENSAKQPWGRSSDLHTAEILNKYSEEMAKRIEEKRI